MKTLINFSKTSPQLLDHDKRILIGGGTSLPHIAVIFCLTLLLSKSSGMASTARQKVLLQTTHAEVFFFHFGTHSNVQLIMRRKPPVPFRTNPTLFRERQESSDESTNPTWSQQWQQTSDESTNPRSFQNDSRTLTNRPNPLNSNDDKRSLTNRQHPRDPNNDKRTLTNRQIPRESNNDQIQL